MKKFKKIKKNKEPIKKEFRPTSLSGSAQLGQLQKKIINVWP